LSSADAVGRKKILQRRYFEILFAVWALVAVFGCGEVTNRDEQANRDNWPKKPVRCN